MGSPCNKTIIVYENRVTITHKIYCILWMSSEVSRTGNSIDKGMNRHIVLDQQDCYEDNNKHRP